MDNHIKEILDSVVEVLVPETLRRGTSWILKLDRSLWVEGIMSSIYMTAPNHECAEQAIKDNVKIRKRIQELIDELT